jgi:hypothetical protein
MLLLTASCTDAGMSRLEAYGEPSHVVCYSGGTVIYDGHSTGRVKSPENSDGWQFKDANIGKLVEVSGDCILTVGG